MKTYILSPNADTLFTSDLKEKLSTISDLTYVKEIQDIKNIPGLLEDTGEKVIAVDPDFCDWKAPNELIDIPNLKAICLQTTSFGWIDTNYAKLKNIPVVNLRGFSTQAVAEYAIYMMIGVAKKIALISQNNNQKDNSIHRGIEISGKTAGIVGLGRIGTKVAQLCKNLGMNVIYFSKNTRDNNFEYSELSELMSKSDFIFPCCAKNPETSTILNEEILRKMSKKSSIISIARGMEFNKDLVIEMVKNKDIYGAGFEEEGGNLNKYVGNIFSAPEVGWLTDGSFSRNGSQWAESILAANRNEYPTRVN